MQHAVKTGTSQKKTMSKILATCRTEYHDLYSEVGMPPPTQATHQQWKKYENRIRGIVRKLMRGIQNARKEEKKMEDGDEEI